MLIDTCLDPCYSPFGFVNIDFTICAMSIGVESASFTRSIISSYASAFAAHSEHRSSSSSSPSPTSFSQSAQKCASYIPSDPHTGQTSSYSSASQFSEPLPMRPARYNTVSGSLNVDSQSWHFHVIIFSSLSHHQAQLLISTTFS